MEQEYKNNIKNEPLLITVKEACNLMNIGRNTMLKLAKIKDFPALVFPHKILIDKNQLPIWIAKNYGNFKN
jgi:excisionase family DNA binding protein